MKTRFLTGITPSGTLHLGNYVGCIRPAIEKAKLPNTESFYFISDYHALIKTRDPDRIEKSRMQIAATWLACGLDPNHVHFYRQSDILEVPELNWILNCITSKGLMNRAHAYKAKVDDNVAAGEDPDNNVSMGLYCYPILMAADILMFNANYIPVGRDQIQHVEMCRDIAQRFNQLYGKEIFTLPEAFIDEEVAVLPGLDGRKMSKSYDNVIPLFEGGEKALKAAILKVVTDCKEPREPKDPCSTSLTQVYDAFATPSEKEEFANKLRDGLGWGEAKEIVFKQINAEIGPKRAKYEELMRNPQVVEDILMEGAARLRPMSQALIEEVRNAVGLRRFKPVQEKAEQKKAKKKSCPKFKQYREKDGMFYFNLQDEKGNVLMTGGCLENGRDLGKLLCCFKANGLKAFQECYCKLSDGVTEEQIEAIRLAMHEEE